MHSAPNQVIIIGVTGGSGSGKTTFAHTLRASLGSEQCAILSQDSYYYDWSSQFDHDGGSVNFDHPNAIEFSLMAQHLAALKRGEEVLVPRYDFKTHQRLSNGQRLTSHPVILVDGILILSAPTIREHLDFAVFIDVEEEVRFQRRLHRDVRERGRSPDGVKTQFFNQVKPMHDQFVEPSRAYAQKVISGKTPFLPIAERLKEKMQLQEFSFV